MDLENLNGDRIRQIGQAFVQGFRRSWRLRAAVFFSLAVCAVMAFFAWPDTSRGGEHIAVSGGSINREEAVKGARAVAIKGSNEAAAGENLRNPFLPEHPDEKQQKLLQKEPLRADGVKKPMGQAKPVHGSVGPVAKGAVQGAAAGGSVTPAPDREDKKSSQSIQLQGIISTEGSMGALLLVGGDTRLLLAGEEVGGCLLEAVEQDEAVIAAGGQHYRLQIGDRAPV